MYCVVIKCTCTLPSARVTLFDSFPEALGVRSECNAVVIYHNKHDGKVISTTNNERTIINTATISNRRMLNNALLGVYERGEHYLNTKAALWVRIKMGSSVSF